MNFLNAKRLKYIAFVFMFIAFTFLWQTQTVKAYAMPFYDLMPKELVLRAEFCTYYTNSSSERKHNIKLASQSINNFLLDVGEEFSFNRVVGPRSERRGYKNAKIILDGEFVDGIGGGVCQVSTTLYNAVLLADLKVLEYHPHSLPVSYVSPSFDAMVNSSFADLRFINNTSNPIIICSTTTFDFIKIQIYGQKLDYSVMRKSKVTGTILPDADQIIFDTDNQYPELTQGQSKQIRFAKNGLTSEGYIIKCRGKKIIENKRIRKDKYNAVRGIIVKSTFPDKDESLNING